jgi:hypothetical protein
LASIFARNATNLDVLEATYFFPRDSENKFVRNLDFDHFKSQTLEPPFRGSF